jgi:hypothetical protein
MIVEELLKKTESETLDFKMVFHDNNASFIHDFISLANSNHECSKYLVFGVIDENGVVTEITGIQNDSNRKNQQQISNILRTSNLNNIPEFSYQEHDYEGKTIGILEIKASDLKPFFLLKDKQEGKKKVRAGVMYSRLGDNNTAIDSCPDDSSIEKMWRRRFNLDKTPEERLRILLQNPEEWKREGLPPYLSHSLTALYHTQFTEFTLQVVTLDDQIGNDVEIWMNGFSDPSNYEAYIYYKHQETNLKCLRCVLLDGSRYILPFPEYKDLEFESKKKRVYYICKNSWEHSLLNLVNLLDFNIPWDRLSSIGYHILNSEQDLSFDLKGWEYPSTTI